MLRDNNFKKWTTIPVILILWAGTSLSGQNSVCFKHKVTDRIKVDCIRFKGKHDAFPQYECSEKPFDPKDEWELIPCSHRKTDDVPDVPKTGEEYILKNSESALSHQAEKDNTDGTMHPTQTSTVD